MRNILIIDTETSSADVHTCELVEVGAILWSVEHRTTIESYSTIVHASANEAEALNGVPAASLHLGVSVAEALGALDEMAARADAVIGHNAIEFDRAVIIAAAPDRPGALLASAWIDSMDIPWPRAGQRRDLISLALAHGVGVISAHRALTDCETLARLFERSAELGADPAELLADAARPKAKVVAMVSFDQRQLAKDAGFRWDPDSKRWWRKMAVADVDGLPFRARIIEEVA